MTDLISATDVLALFAGAQNSRAAWATAVVTEVNKRVAALPAPSPSPDSVLIANAIGKLSLNTSTTPPVTATVKMADFVGINVHLNYTDNDTYSDAHKVDLALVYLGVTHIRTAAPNPNDQGQGNFALLANRGYKFLMICGASPVAQTVAALAAMETAVPGCIAGIEGPNEVNNSGGSGFNQGDTAGAQAYQAALYAAVKANPILSQKDVWGFTDYPDATNKCDVANFHCYPNGEPTAALASGLTSQVTANPGVAFGCTEFGYNTGAGGPAPAVSPADQATFLTAGIQWLATRKASRVYVYELFDTTAYKSTGGLFNDDGSPKPAADAVKALVAAG